MEMGINEYTAAISNNILAMARKAMREFSAGGVVTLNGSVVRVFSEDASLEGQTVTVTDGEESATGVIANGRCDIPAILFNGVVTVSATGTNGKMSQEVVNIKEYRSYYVELNTAPVFAFHYSENNSDPTSVDYPAGFKNENYTPFTMDQSTGVPNYGDWTLDGEDTAWLYPRSCMLKYDGTVDYYLDESNETLKEDGSASDVTSSAYGGNAMMEWGRGDNKHYWKLVPDADGNGFTFCVTGKPRRGYKAWNYYNSLGNVATHFYTPKYVGSNDGARLRSISGMGNYVNTATADQVAKAMANNPSGQEMWYIETWVDRFFLWMMHCLIGKSMNVQAVFGTGRCKSSNTAAVANNTLNGKGLFCGYSNETSDVKTFGMQGQWGNLWRRTAGMINDNGTIRYKLTYGKQDGSNVEGYNLDGVGYLPGGTVQSGVSGGYWTKMNILENTLTPNTANGSATTYYCDGGWTNNGQINYLLSGGGWANGAVCGFALDLSDAVSHARASIGAALSCKPLA